MAREAKPAAAAGQSEPAGGVQSAEGALAVLATLAEHGGELGLGELARAAGISPSRSHRYLVSLVRTGYVERSPLGRYALGWRALRVGLVALSRLDVIEQASAALYGLRERVGATVMLAVWGPAGPVIVRWLAATQPVTVNGRVGVVLPVLASACGQVFAAFLPRETTWDLICRELAAELQESPPAGRGQDVERLLADVRTCGFGRMQGSLAPGVQAIAAPVFAHDGGLAAAIALLGAEGYIDPSLEGADAVALSETASELSRRLGFRKPLSTD